MPSNPLRSLLAPTSMAVIGASADPTRMSGMIVAQARRLGFAGDVYPINPKYQEIAGFPCFPSILDLRDTPPEAAVIYLNAEAAVAAAEQCAEVGVKSLIVLSAGFAEIGGDGVALQKRLLDVCRGAGMTACGPNTAGLANFNAGFVAYGSSGFAGLDDLGGGNVAIISSSGGLGTALLSYCRERGLGVSHLIGIGNEGITTAADYLGALVDDPGVRCVLALLESIRDADGFFAAADRAVRAGKQVIVMKQGRSEVGLRSVQSHTAAMGGSAVDFEAACRAHGIVVVRELHALADQALLATTLRTVSGYDIGVLSLPGGGTSLLADAASDQGFQLPPLSEHVASELQPMVPAIAVVKNPLDPTAGFGKDQEKLRQTLKIFSSDPAFGVVFFFQAAAEPEYCAATARTLVAARDEMEKPLACVWESGPGLEEAWSILRAAGIPLFVSVVDAFSALGRHRWYDKFAARTAVEHSGGAAAGERGAPRSAAVPARGSARDLIDQVGLIVPRSEVVTGPDEAAEVAAQIGFPVVMKVESARIEHKSDVGGVRLGIRSADEARAAYRDIVDTVASHVGADAIEGVLVQQTVPAGTELLIGVHTDEQVGPLVTVGFGGVLTELFGDMSRRPAPVSRREAHEMLDELKIAPLLRGYRGAPAADVEGLAEIIENVGRVAHEWRSESPEFEFNPVIVGPVGHQPVAVDWLMR